MIQRAFVLISLLWMLLPGVAISADQAIPSVEQRFHDGITCLQSGDTECARRVLDRIPAQSPYAKVLSGSIAATAQDMDAAFNLLLPLKASTALNDEAAAILHASLAIAYDKEQNHLRALEERIAAEGLLASPEKRSALHNHIWNSLSSLSREELVSMRGESMSTDTQGWIDLALATKEQDDHALKSWPDFYPGHPAGKGFSQELLSRYQAPPTASAPADNEIDTTASSDTGDTGKIGLILPFAVEAYYPASDAIEQGFAAAQSHADDKRELKLYASDGNPANITTIYQQAINDGVQIILGPLTREEVTRLGQQPALEMPTLSLNQTDNPLNKASNLFLFGLPLETEIMQTVRTAQRLGMQTATIVTGSNHLAERLAQAFENEWAASGGRIALRIVFEEDADLTELQNQIKANPADMIFLAANSEEARDIRPYLDAATPTFSTSHIYAGIPQDADNEALNAVRFIDMPWLLNPDAAEFAPFKPAAADLPPGEMQRWFALGVDAYRILDHLHNNPSQAHTLHGLTGKISISTNGTISRELASGRFSKDDVVLERAP